MPLVTAGTSRTTLFSMGGWRVTSVAMAAQSIATCMAIGCLVCDGQLEADGRATVPVGSGFVHIACLNGLSIDVIAGDLARTIERDGVEAVVRRVRWAARDYDRPIRASLLRLAGMIERAAHAMRDTGHS